MRRQYGSQSLSPGRQRQRPALSKGLGRGRRPADLTGPYFLRYSLAAPDDANRTRITDAVYQWFAELQLFQGKEQQGKSEKTLRAYNYRLGFFLDFTAQNDLRYPPSSRHVSECRMTSTLKNGR
jgi:hypothetical protein